MPSIECRKLRFSQTFDDRENCSVDETQPEISVRRHQLADALVILRRQRLDLERAGPRQREPASWVVLRHLEAEAAPAPKREKAPQMKLRGFPRS